MGESFQEQLYYKRHMDKTKGGWNQGKEGGMAGVVRSGMG